jgi:short chain dehydrogenase
MICRFADQCRTLHNNAWPLCISWGNLHVPLFTTSRQHSIEALSRDLLARVSQPTLLHSFLSPFSLLPVLRPYLIIIRSTQRLNHPSLPRMSPKKTILITGCSSGGIGAALAYAFASRGHYVFATARNTSKIPSTFASVPNVRTLQLDVTSASSISETAGIVATATQDQGARGLDVLINNAGSGYTMPLLDVDLDEAKKVYDVNIWGMLRTIQAFTPLLIDKGGRVVNVSSVGGVVNTPWIGTYAPF